MSNDHILSFDAFNLSGGQYKKIFSNNWGPFCDFLYEKSVEKTVKSAFASTNTTMPYGTCPFQRQVIQFNDYAFVDEADFLPPYLPGNERWKLDLFVSKDDVKVTGFRLYAIVRDNQKLFDSKWLILKCFNVFYKFKL